MRKVECGVVNSQWYNQRGEAEAQRYTYHPTNHTKSATLYFYQISRSKYHISFFAFCFCAKSFSQHTQYHSSMDVNRIYCGFRIQHQSLAHVQPKKASIELSCRNLTKGPVAGEHVGEVGDDIEGGVDDVRHREVDDEVVRHGAHSGVGHHNPYHWGGFVSYDDADEAVKEGTICEFDFQVMRAFNANWSATIIVCQPFNICLNQRRINPNDILQLT